jgi:hypothetical protein
MSAQRLADRCAELGYPVPRNVIANLESGRKDSVSVAELLVVAEALEVPPVLLLFPVGRAHGAHRAPARDPEPLVNAVRWFTGEHGERRPGYWDADPYYDNSRPLRLYREHEAAARLARDAEKRAMGEEYRATQADSQADRAAALQAADFQKHVMDAQLERMRRIRAFLHHEGLLLPPMPKQFGRAVRAKEKGDAYREFEFSMKRVDPVRYWGEEDFDEPDPDGLDGDEEEAEYDEYTEFEYDELPFDDPEDE